MVYLKILLIFLKKNANLFHISSTSVYGVQSNLVDENCRNLRPQSPYADLKLLEEKTLKNLGKKINFITFRFVTVLGFQRYEISYSCK